MKKLLDKTGAKIAFFILLIVFSALAAAGGLGIGFLAENDVFLDGGRKLNRGMYEGVCENELSAVYAYLTGSEFTVPPSEEYCESFSREFKNSPCAIEVSANRQQILVNYFIYTRSPYSLSADYDIDGKDISVVAYANPKLADTDYESAIQRRLIDGRYVLIAAEVLCLAAAIFCLVFTLASAGHWKGCEGIHLTWYDKIPVEIWLAAIILGFVCVHENLNLRGPWAYAAPALLIYLFLPAFAAQCKAGRVLKGSVIAWVLRLLGKMIKWFGYVLGSIPLVWKTALAVALILAFDVLCVCNYWDVEYPIAMLAVNVLAGLYLVFTAAGLKKLQKGGKALAAGNYDERIDTKYLLGDFRRHGEDLNAIQQGVKNAVEEQMRSERMKTELITNVSHDIKTPVTSIVNYVDLLKKEPLGSSAAQEYVEVLDRQSRRLSKLTEDLVEASKAASGNIAVAPEDTDVNVLLTQVLGEYRQRLMENQLEPVFTPDESDPHILADGRLLWRVLDNLLGNACKYAMPGTRVYLSSETEDGRVSITVKNVSRYPLNVPADELTERFVRGDVSRSTEGSGLGLSIAMGLTQLQHGEFKLFVDGDLFKVRLSFNRI